MKTKATDLLLSSQTSCRVLLIGIVLSCLHTAGILISAYLMTERILEPDLPEKPFLHVCTEAIICPFYRILGGLTAIIVQLIGSGKISGQNITDMYYRVSDIGMPFFKYLALLSIEYHCISIWKIPYFNAYLSAIFFQKIALFTKMFQHVEGFFSPLKKFHIQQHELFQ